MSLKNYVYSHPVNVFIIGRLGLSVEVFCELYGFKQGTFVFLGYQGKNSCFFCRLSFFMGCP